MFLASIFLWGSFSCLNTIQKGQSKKQKILYVQCGVCYCFSSNSHSLHSSVSKWHYWGSFWLAKAILLVTKAGLKVTLRRVLNRPGGWTTPPTWCLQRPPPFPCASKQVEGAKERCSGDGGLCLKARVRCTSTWLHCPPLLQPRDSKWNKLYVIWAKVEDIIILLTSLRLSKFTSLRCLEMTSLFVQAATSWIFSKPEIYLTSAAWRWFISTSMENMSWLVMYLLHCNGNKSSGDQACNFVLTKHNTQLSHYLHGHGRIISFSIL